MLWRVSSRRVRSRSKPPGFILPCQPAPADRPPAGPGWLHEIKFDAFIGAIGLAPGVPGGVAELGYWLGVASGATALPRSRGHQSTGAPALRFRAVGRRH